MRVREPRVKLATTGQSGGRPVTRDFGVVDGGANPADGAKKERHAALPIPPYFLSRTEAAAYVRVSPTTFDKMVADGLMPKRRRIYGRVLWSLRALTKACEALDSEEDTDNPYAHMAL